MVMNKIPNHLCAVLAVVAALLVGCDDDHHHVTVIVPVTGDIEGFAYFPYEDEWGNYPVYYETGNYDILVTLYYADDIHYEFPVRYYYTDTDGYFWFDNVAPDWYFLTAEAQEYDPVLDITDYYFVETPYDFLLREDEIYFDELFLVWVDSEYGYPLSAAYMNELAQLGPGELEDGPELEQIRQLQLERFRRQGKQRPSELSLKSQSEQTDSQPATE